MKNFNELVTEEEVEKYLTHLLKKSNCEHDYYEEDGNIRINHFSEINLHELQLQTDMDAYFGEELDEGSYKEVMNMYNKWYGPAITVRWIFNKFCRCTQGFVDAYSFNDYYQVSMWQAQVFVLNSFLKDNNIFIPNLFGGFEYTINQGGVEVQFPLSKEYNEEKLRELKFSLAEYSIKYRLINTNTLFIDLMDLRREVKRYIDNTVTIKVQRNGFY